MACAYDYDLKLPIRIDLAIAGTRLGEIDGVALYADECDGPIAVYLVDQYETRDETKWIEVTGDSRDGGLILIGSALWAATRERKHVVEASCRMADLALQRATDRIAARADYERMMYRDRLMAAE